MTGYQSKKMMAQSRNPEPDGLVNRLRSKNCCDETKCNCDESADRIEVLEAALRWYAENCAANGDKIEGPSGDYGQRARAALAGEKD